jgi:hypothetical protein
MKPQIDPPIIARVLSYFFLRNASPDDNFLYRSGGFPKCGIATLPPDDCHTRDSEQMQRPI